MEADMPSRSLCIAPILTVILVIGLFGCSGSGGAILPDMSGTDVGLTPGIEGQGSNSEQDTNNFLWGYYLFHLNADHTAIDVEPIREAQFHFNVVGYLQNPPGTYNLFIENVSWSDTGTLLVDVYLRHPFPTSEQLIGRDVRGIAILPAEKVFISTIIKDVYGDLTPIYASRRLLNADGYTTLWNRWTAPEVFHPQLFGYIKGIYASPDEYFIEGNLHGYKAFWTDPVGRLFMPGQGNTRTYEFDFPPGPLTFAYAVDANWEQPINLPISPTPEDDFPPSAHCLEPFQISAGVTTNSMTKIGGSAVVQFDVSDWQDATVFSHIHVEAPDLFFGTLDPGAPIGFPFPDTARYEVTVPNTKGNATTTGGGSDLLIVVEDVENSVVNPDLTAYNILKVPVADIPGFWRDRNGDDSFVNVPLVAPLIEPSSLSNGSPDLAIISFPDPECDLFAGEPEILLFNDVDEQFICWDRELDSTAIKFGYPGNSPSWLYYPHSVDATINGWFGLGSTSTTAISGTNYEVRHTQNMFNFCGQYQFSWHTGTDDGTVAAYLETIRDVTTGFGNVMLDPVYGLFAYDSGAIPAVCHVLMVGEPYGVPPPQNVFRADLPMINAGFVPQAINPSIDRLRSAIDSYSTGFDNLHHAYYVLETDLMGASEIEGFDINFSNLPINPIWTLTDADIKNAFPGAYAIDIEVVPSRYSNVTIIGETVAGFDWLCVLMTNNTHYWLAFYDPLNPAPDSPGNDPYLPSYTSTLSPILGANFKPMAMDVDLAYFEVYVLSKDDTAIQYMTVYEYFY